MGEFDAALKRAMATLPPALGRVAGYLDRNRTAVLASSAAEIAIRTDTSNATVIRAIQALGFEGLPALKRAFAEVLTESASAETNMRQTLAEVGADVAGAVEAVLDAHVDAMADLRSTGGRAALCKAIAAIHTAKRIVVFGIGPSSSIANYMALQLSRCARPSFALDATGWSLADQLLGLRTGDAVVLLVYGKAHREARAVMGEARRLGLTTVLVTDVDTVPMAREATVVILARRGRANRVALHATTLAALEAIILGLAAIDQTSSLSQLAELNRLRRLVAHPPER